MKEQEALEELSSIRNLMERSTKFISLHGLSGVLAGCYALVGACFAYWTLNQAGEQLLIVKLSLLALLVLFFSIGTAILLSRGKARKSKQQIWNPASKGLLIHGGIPLLVGGLFILILLYQGYFSIIVPSCLIFYGLALVSASHYTFRDIRRLGLLETLLGLGATVMPQAGLWFWSIGFGLLHILYGLIMYYKYDRIK